MSNHYLIERARDCDRLAREERDPDLREMLRDLEQDYRAKAVHAGESRAQQS